VLFCYDSLITTGDEMRYFWGRKITGAAVLYWLNKYMTLFDFTWDFRAFLKMSDSVSTIYCAATTAGVDTVANLLFLVLATFTAIRVYALRKSVLLASIAFLLAAVPVGTNFAVFAYGLTGENIFPYGCTAIDETPLHVAKMFTAVTRACAIAADCLAAGITWFSLSRRYDFRHAGETKGTLTSVLLVDGECNIILAVLNVLHVTFTLLSFDIPALQSSSVISNFVTPVSSMLLSRFLLHLQAANLRAVNGGSSQASTAAYDGSIFFERVVGSMGASISSDDFLQEEREEEYREAEGVADKRASATIPEVAEGTTVIELGQIASPACSK
ncbi:hypothetical protein BD311DRAFT_676052, partial [Dichomitus squalens]